MRYSWMMLVLATSLMCLVQCGNDADSDEQTPEEPADIFFGADLSYVNQIEDHGGSFRSDGAQQDPYKIFSDKGTNLVRVRIWHNPVWTKSVYGEAGTQLYSDLKDVEKTISRAKAQGMKVLLDFHYSDTWADPGKQEIPAAWREIKNISVLGDSVYNYTAATLQYLDGKGLMPELVQVGNETNCGMLYTDAPDGFPSCNVCNDSWTNLGTVVNRAITAVRTVAATSAVKTKIVLHVADPKNIEWWFDNTRSKSSITDFDIIGISFYPIWHNTVSVAGLSDAISKFRTKYGKDVMIVETAYPWTNGSNDSYNNLFGSQLPVSGYSFSQTGQLNIMKAITQEVIDGGGVGVIYWEPAWITSDMKDLWGTGSAWENCAFFDFGRNALPVFDYMKATYK